MDSLFDGNWLKLVIPIILFILFSLPDVLRKRRKYPSNKKRKQQDKEKAKAKAPEDILAQSKPVDEDIPDIAKPRQPKPAEAPTPVTTLPEPEPEPTPVVTIPKPVRPTVVAPQVPVTPATAVPHMVHGEPWAELSPEGRDIYAGLIWSELLEPPLALRRKRR